MKSENDLAQTGDFPNISKASPKCSTVAYGEARGELVPSPAHGTCSRPGTKLAIAQKKVGALCLSLPLLGRIVHDVVGQGRRRLRRLGCLSASAELVVAWSVLTRFRMPKTQVCIAIDRAYL